MRFVVSACSQIGKVRSTNEDAMLIRTARQGGLFLVADGISGREYGEIASGVIRDGYAHWWDHCFLPGSERLSFQSAIAELKNVFMQLNSNVVERYGEAAVGSTLALLFIFHSNCLYLSAGDSRIYLARKLSFRQVTIDDIVGSGNEKDRQYACSERGKLLGAFGISSTPAINIRTDKLLNRDRFFLCSDGAYHYLLPQTLSRRILLGQLNPDNLIDDFSKEIERKGACDNYTMIYVQAKDTGL